MKKAKILLVDDEVAFTKYLSFFLSKRGHAVSAVYDGPSAINIVEEDDFDVAILDLRMPGLDGIETLKVLKKKKPFMEVIILTGHGTIDSAIKGVECGAFDYATKPIVIVDLYKRIAEAFERKMIHEAQTREQP